MALNVHSGTLTIDDICLDYKYWIGIPKTPIREDAVANVNVYQRTLKIFINGHNTNETDQLFPLSCLGAGVVNIKADNTNINLGRFVTRMQILMIDGIIKIIQNRSKMAVWGKEIHKVRWAILKCIYYDDKYRELLFINGIIDRINIYKKGKKLTQTIEEYLAQHNTIQTVHFMLSKRCPFEDRIIIAIDTSFSFQQYILRLYIAHRTDITFVQIEPNF